MLWCPWFPLVQVLSCKVSNECFLLFWLHLHHVLCFSLYNTCLLFYIIVQTFLNFYELVFTFLHRLFQTLVFNVNCPNYSLVYSMIKSIMDCKVPYDLTFNFSMLWCPSSPLLQVLCLMMYILCSSKKLFDRHPTLVCVWGFF